MPNIELIDKLHQKGAFYASIEISKEIRPDLGQLGFDDLVDDFENLQALGKRIAECSWKGISNTTINACLEAFSELDQALTRIRQFNALQSGNAAFERNSLFANLRQGWQRLYTAIVPHLCFSEKLDDEAERYRLSLAGSQSEIDTMKAKVNANAEAAFKSIKADQERMKALVEDVERMAQQSGVTDQASHFKALADGYRTAAWVWAGLAAIAGFGLYLYLRKLELPEVQTPLALVANILPRLITVTLLSTAVIFCVRNFSAMMHNVIVNRHRQTALTTFKTFVNSTEDGGTRNAVLIQSTQAIFSPQPSGYLKNDTEMPQVSQVTEIVRSLAGKDKE